MANNRVREPVYEISITESGSRRTIHFETIHGRLIPTFTDSDSIMRRRIEAEDKKRYFLRTPASEAANARRRG